MELVPTPPPEGAAPPAGRYAADLVAHAYLLNLHEPLAEAWESRELEADSLNARQQDYQQWFEQAYRDDLGVAIEHRESLKAALIGAIQDGCRLSLADVLATVDSSSTAANHQRPFGGRPASVPRLS